MASMRTQDSAEQQVALVMQVDAACERFETDFRAGRSPLIENLLSEYPESARLPLLRELLALELELRRKQGDRPAADEYLARFPDRGELIQEIFHEATAPSAADAATASEQGTIWGWSHRSDAAHPPQDPHVSPDAPERFGDYELLGEIARGGMGIVYRARQVKLNRVVALKMILSGRFATEEEVQRFQREAEAAASLDHPHIVPIYEVGRHRGRSFFSMKLIEGGSLSKHLARLLHDPRAAARLMVTVARAVHDAHRRGFVHRDLKPANILLDASGHPHVTDFGLAKQIGKGGTLTESGVILGTPSYMAPEQAAGRSDVSARADIYSLGAILYELLTGRPPFRAETVMETVVQVLEVEPIPPSRVRSGVPRELEQICLKCLEKNPGGRYTTASALADDLERYLRGEGAEASRSSLGDHLRRSLRREPELAARLLGLALIGLLTQVNFVLNPNPDVAVHIGVSMVEALWFFTSLGLHRLSRSTGAWSRWGRATWIAVDIAHATAMLRILDAGTSSLVVCYPLLIAASGLWYRVRLVWLTTALAIAGYGALALDTYLRGVSTDSNYYPHVFIVVLAVTGFVVAHPIKRIWALSSYYEHRPCAAVTED
jgi:eukaryotic-like serine/threonine-protein kinase